VSRRDAIKMSDAEALDFLEEQKTVVVATLGPRGWPHLMPLWYVVRDGRLWGWTYAKSQKAVNLSRDPRCTLQVETGVDYAELRGVMLECEAVVHRDLDVVTDIGLSLTQRYSAPGTDVAAQRDTFRAQAPKRVGLEFAERRRVTWDHRKLGGVY
jgi:PPOX class probable F420-dependent enzyme